MEKAFLLKLLDKLPALLRHLYTLFLVAVSWAIFAVEDFSQLGAYLKAMFGLAGMVLLPLLPACTADFRRSLHPPGRPALEASAGAVHASFAARAPAGGTGLFHRLAGGRHV